MNELDAAIEDLYLAFSDLPSPKSIDACPCCIDDKNLDKLVNAIAREVSPEDLTSYASSAFLTAGDIPDYLYFLPRILEISVRDEWWWPDIEITGRALLETNIPTWPDRRQQAHTESADSARQHRGGREAGFERVHTDDAEHPQARVLRGRLLLLQMRSVCSRVR